ncbi:hypothetical protein ACHAPJ_012277 [Fusarium lateritium]
MSTTRKILIVGASRGIGAELTRQFATVPNHQVIAAVRDKSLLVDTQNIRYITLDQNSPDSVITAAKEVDDLDILVLNAAIGDDEQIETTTDRRLHEYLDSNVVGPHRVIRAFLPALHKGIEKKIIYVSSTSGSLARQVASCQGFSGPYSISKGAGNMLVIQYQNELKDRGFCVVAVHPGWVATDMGILAGDGGIPVTQSVEGLRKLILGLRASNGAHFFNYDGTLLPW